MAGPYNKKNPKEEISEAPQVEELLKNLEFHKAIQQITSRINAADTLREIVIDIKEDIRKLFNIHSLTIYLIDKSKKEIFTLQKSGGGIKELRFPIDYSTFAGCVVQKKKMLHIADAYNEREIRKINDALSFDPGQDKKMGIKTGQIIASPILYDGNIQGVMEIMNKKDGDTIDDYNQIFLDEIEGCLAKAFFMKLEFEQTSQKHRAKLDKLIRDKVISPERMDQALKEAFESKKDLAVILMEQYDISKDDIGSALSDHFSCPFAAYSDDVPITRQLSAGIEQSTLVKMLWIPVKVVKGKIHVLIDDPWDQSKKRDIEKILETNAIQYYVALASDILKMIDRAYPDGEAVFEPLARTGSAEQHKRTMESPVPDELPAKPGRQTVPENIILHEPEPEPVALQINVAVQADTAPARVARDEQAPPPPPQTVIQSAPQQEGRLHEEPAVAAETQPPENLRKTTRARHVAEKPEGVLSKPAARISPALTSIILEAANRQASDIHFEPDTVNKNVSLRIRTNGQFLTLQSLSYDEYGRVIDDIKTSANLEVKNHSVIQHGRLKVQRPSGDDIPLRVVIIPTQTGMEDAVIHLSAKARKIPLELLGLSTGSYTDLINILRQPRGMIFIVGPAGAGMTTTLHACLEYLNTPEKKIWTAEESVEIRQNGLRQVTIDPQNGFAFPRVLRSFLNADPDVIMASRVPDLETARICMEAALQGRLVLSTLWAENIIDTIEKCLEMGLGHLVFADAMLSIVEQRLIQALCPNCKEKYHPSREEYEELAEIYGKDAFDKLNIPYSGSFTLYHPRGCSNCGQTGYLGRMCVSEILIFTPPIKRLIRRKESAESIYRTAVAAGMTTLLQDGIAKVLQGYSDSRQVRLACLK
ncbi:MAG: Flp pilus assembly complex ATPase component TadA [Deltaproteobacteria bacterium]